MKRPTAEEERVAGVIGHADEGFAKKFPLLNAYLCDTAWDDGKPRETSALSFTVKDGQWQLALNDKALKTSAYTSAPTMQDCLRLLEKALAGGEVGWRPWKRGK